MFNGKLAEMFNITDFFESEDVIRMYCFEDGIIRFQCKMITEYYCFDT